MNRTEEFRPLTQEDKASFERDGFLVLRNFYDSSTEIRPIQRDIHALIGLLIDKYKLPIAQPAFSPEAFDAGYQQLIAHDRKLGGVIYDAVKQIPAFVRLSANAKHDEAMRQLRPNALPGVAAGGYGIRIDNPSEEKFRADWHQDYPAQFRSIDGLVFWSPLVAMTEELGPVRFCIGSHKDGLVPIHTRDPDNPEKTGAYGLRLHQRDERVARYKQIAPLLNPGDLVIIDFLALHAGGANHAQRSRWSMQIRYFNFRDETGVRIEWAGSFAAGTAIQQVHPELLVDEKPEFV